MARDDIKKAALSGAASGGLLGLGGGLLSGGGIKSALRAAALGALGGGAVSGAGVGAGSALMGEPEEGEISPYTRRGALGGGTVGAGLGGLLGAALGKNYLKMAKFPSLGKLGGKKGALLGGLGGGGAGAFMAGDEGMQLDFIQNELDAMEKKRRADQIAKSIVDGTFEFDREP